MPLLDHFHPPLYPLRRWESFHAYWAPAIGEWLNSGVLPDRYFAEVQVHVGSRVEVDVGTFDDPSSSASQASRPAAEGAVALAVAPAWVVPEPTMTLPIIFPDVVEVLVYSQDGGNALAGAIELISPGNKDRPEARTAFASKCVTYLHEGVGVVIVDIVTERRANLHHTLLNLLGDDMPRPLSSGFDLYASAYRPVRRPTSEHLDVWSSELEIGGDLPVLPLALSPRLSVPVDLDATYQDACRKARLPGRMI